MSNLDNRRIHIDSFVHEEILKQDDLAVLYIAPLALSAEQKKFVKNKYDKFLSTDTKENHQLLDYNSIKAFFIFGNDSKVVQRLVEYFQLCKKISKEIKRYKTIHLFVFTKVSFLFQIIPLLVLGKFFRKEVVVEFLDFKNYYYPEETGMVTKYFLQFVDAVITQSDRQSRSLRQKSINAHTLRTLPLFTKTQRIIEQVQPMILANVHLENVFNINCLLKAFGLVKQKYPRAELIIAGSGSQKSRIMELVFSSTLSGIRFEKKSEVNRLMREVDIYVHCYHIEYFAIEILEAMSNGIPVLSSPLGMVTDLIQNENILMYQFNDFSTLADNFILLIEDNALVKKLSRNGYTFVQELSSATSPHSLNSFYKNLS